MGPLHAFGARVAMGDPPPVSPGYGPLIPKGELALPAPFEYQVISRQGQLQTDGTPTPTTFDGMGAFPGQHGTTVLIRNHENLSYPMPRPAEIPVLVPPGLRYDQDPAYDGGCTKLEVRRDPHTGTYEVVQNFNILGGTTTNCAGGVVPFEKWITCEEDVNRSPVTGTKHGYSFEVDAMSDAPVQAVPILGAGRFAHEAIAWRAGILYQTEDRNNRQGGGACFYRYVPDERVGQSGNLAETTGTLQALKLEGEPRADMDTGRVVGQPYDVEWVTIDDPDHNDDTDMRQDRVPGFTPVRFQAQDKGAAVFDREEGIWSGVGDSKIYFDCTTGGAQNLGQVWEYDPGRETITLIYESVNPQSLENPDNVVIVPRTGDIFLCEDGGGQDFIRGLTQEGEIYDFAMAITNQTELCGATFDPEGETLFVNQQGNRPPTQTGAVTYAIFGPFEKREGDNSKNLGTGP
jgi:uncharacterized protein